MSQLTRLNRSLLTGALALALGAQAQAALIVSDALEGAWYNADEGGRGALIDYVPKGPGTGVLFVAIFSYDTAGNPLWLTTQTAVNEGQFKWSNLPVLRFVGGSFGSPFSTPSSTSLGTANITFNSCSDLRISFTPGAGTTLPAASYTFDRPGAVPQACAYKTAFTACPTGTTAVAGVERTCRISSPVTGSVNLTNSATYLIDGPTRVGEGRNINPGVLTVEPGTLITGSGASLSYLAVQPGSKLIAQGLQDAPIIFTGPTPVNGSWAGLVLAGNAQCNSSQDGVTPCTFEAVASQQFGGNNNFDSSGILEYVQVRYAGQEVRPNEELNSVTLLGVGSATLIKNVQIYGGKDDGFEMFGGTVNLRNVVMLGVEDDSLDFDNGYQGNIQFAYIRQIPAIGSIGTDSNGIESDNHPSAFDLLPRTRPTVSNFTVIGGTGGNEGMRLRRGSAGKYSKGLVVGFTGEGLNFNDNATFVNAGNPAALGSELTMRDMYLSNTTNFENNAADPFQISAWYAAGNNNRVGSNPLSGTTPFPAAGSTLTLAAPNIPNDFFEATDYIGAFRSSDANWAAGWTYDFR